MNPKIRLLAMLAAALVPFVWVDRAEAQYGGIGGFGFGFGFNNNAYSETNFLNSRSNTLTQIAGANKPQPLQAPRFQTRDDSIYDKYDLSTRQSMVNRIAVDPGREMSAIDPTGELASRPRRPSTAAAPAAPAGPSEPTTMNLANFFNKDQQLVWPSSAPISGEFGKKQSIADLATLAVLNEYDLRGLARVSTVTDARQKLLDYGRPALQQVREQSTPALADSFHVFLLSLYGNLGAAATVPKAR
jgi:hypothetical protein